jgi:L-2-hydroxyglutarate oxidase
MSQMTSNFDYTVVGAGIVGLSTAYKLQLKYPDAKILVLEKENKPAYHQTGRNSGVIHSGIYYKPGSLKARTCVGGYKQLVEFVKEFDVEHDICGKLIVATTDEEVQRLPGIFKRGEENGLTGLRIIGPEEIKEIEPFSGGLQAIRVEQTGIVDYPAMSQKLADRILALQPKSEIHYNEEVQSIEHLVGGSLALKTSKGKYSSARLIGCGGLQADRLARLDGIDPSIRIVPFRGDYYELAEHAWHKVKHLIYPVPDPNFPFLGVHFTRMIHGGAECGPNAVFSFAREGYNKTDFNLEDTASSLGFIGTWKLFGLHWRYGLGEYERAFSKTKFLKALQKLMPKLEMEDLVTGRAGIRAQALNKDGGLVDDFVIEKGENTIHVLNAPSPAATASLAIADEILGMAQI